MKNSKTLDERARITNETLEYLEGAVNRDSYVKNAHDPFYMKELTERVLNVEPRRWRWDAAVFPTFQALQDFVAKVAREFGARG